MISNLNIVHQWLLLLTDITNAELLQLILHYILPHF